MNKYPIYEYFYSWNGEGFHSGKSAFFIRTYGCPLKCNWCDSAGTWHPKYKPKNILQLSSKQIHKLINKNINHVVITGGEPALFDWNELTDYSDIDFHLETSGVFPIIGNFKWITVSPKFNKLPNIENIKIANELKLIIENENTIESWINKFPSILDHKLVYLNPEWSQRNNEKVLNSITDFVLKNKNFRAGYQIHKLYRCDFLDKNCKSEIPLGGK